jgi:hypothetical protein
MTDSNANRPRPATTAAGTAAVTTVAIGLARCMGVNDPSLAANKLVPRENAASFASVLASLSDDDRDYLKKRSARGGLRNRLSG